MRHLPRVINWYFLVYLLLWSLFVSAAMMAATGLAAHGLVSHLSVTQWGILHALLALIVVYRGIWKLLERMMKGFIALMFLAILSCSVLILCQQPKLLLDIFQPSLPAGSLSGVLSLIGGVGGSVTLLSYGYWIRESGWQGAERLETVRLDLGLAYSLTGLFAISIIILAAGLKPGVIGGNGMALALADQLAATTHPVFLWVFLLGFWGATFSSMLGVWHGVPYLFANWWHIGLQQTKMGKSVLNLESLARSRSYRWYLLAMVFLPMLLLVQDRPVWIVKLYAVTGALFMPLLAVILLLLNSRRQLLGEYVSSYSWQIGLVFCLVFFVGLLGQGLVGM